MRISVDFDETLDRVDVQLKVKELINKHEIWIVTSRRTVEELLKHNLHFDNLDLFSIARELNIPKERIVFTNHAPKWTFFKSSNLKFDIHIENDELEIKEIKENTSVIPVDVEKIRWKVALTKALNRLQKINEK